MKIGVIETSKKHALTIRILLEILGFLPIIIKKNNLKNINPKKVKVVILNAKLINKKNKHFLTSFLERNGNILLYGKPSDAKILRQTFNIKILRIKARSEFGHVGKNFISHLEKNKYFNERKLPFFVDFLLKWDGSKEFGKITTGKAKSAIAYMSKILNGYVMYMTPDVFGSCYSLLTDQNDRCRIGFFKRKFPIDALLYVYSQILYECVNKLSKDDIVITKWHWPSNYLSAISLTHDIDTEYCSKQGLVTLRNIERTYKVNSVWFFRPGDRYKIPEKAIKMLLRDKCEIGLHSINDAIKDEAECKRQKEYIETFTGNKIFGVRSHALSRISNVTQDTDKSAGFIYESTIPDTDNCVPKQQFKGNTIFFPYNYYFSKRYVKKKLIILPLTIHDWWYIRGNKWHDKKTMSFYIEKTDYIIKKYGLNMFLVHPADYMTGSHRSWMYDKYLNYITKIPNLWISNSISIANWIIRRAKINFDYKYENGILTIQINEFSKKYKSKEESFSLLINKNIDKIKILGKNKKTLNYEIENLQNKKRLVTIIS